MIEDLGLIRTPGASRQESREHCWGPKFGGGPQQWAQSIPRHYLWLSWKAHTLSELSKLEVWPEINETGKSCLQILLFKFFHFKNDFSHDAALTSFGRSKREGENLQMT